jgi:hypothetical protein
MNVEYSPDYPTVGYPTFRFIRPALLERSILSIANSACSEMNRIPPLGTVYILRT